MKMMRWMCLLEPRNYGHKKFLSFCWDEHASSLTTVLGNPKPFSLQKESIPDKTRVEKEIVKD